MLEKTKVKSAADGKCSCAEDDGVSRGAQKNLRGAGKILHRDLPRYGLAGPAMI